MNTVLWVLQVILTIKFASVALTHGFRHEKAEMRTAIQKMGPTARPLLMVIALLTLVGGGGLVFPSAFGNLSWTTSPSAAMLAVMMLFLIIFHIRCRVRPALFADVILFILTFLVAYGRWFLSPHY
jgi:hypothetical protein